MPTLSRFIFIDKQTEWHLNLAQHAHYVSRNVVYSTDAIKLMILNGIELAIIIDQWARLLMINTQTLSHCILMIIVTLHQWLTRLIVYIRPLGWIVINVIDTTGPGMHSSSTQALNDFLIRNRNL